VSLGFDLSLLCGAPHFRGPERTIMNMHVRLSPSPDRLTVRVNDALHMLGIGRTKLYALIGAGEIETIKLGKATLIPVASLTDFVDRQRARGAQ
jgi:excisionase family DNA binding protein